MIGPTLPREMRFLAQNKPAMRRRVSSLSTSTVVYSLISTAAAVLLRPAHARCYAIVADAPCRPTVGGLAALRCCWLAVSRLLCCRVPISARRRIGHGAASTIAVLSHVQNGTTTPTHTRIDWRYEPRLAALTRPHPASQQPGILSVPETLLQRHCYCYYYYSLDGCVSRQSPHSLPVPVPVPCRASAGGHHVVELC